MELLRPDGSVSANGVAGPDGGFAVPAAPGRYSVLVTAVAPGPGRGCQAEPAQVVVAAASFTDVAVTCDTGIR